MRKIFFISCLIVSCLATSFSTEAQVNFGVKGGLSVANTRFDSDTPIDTDYGLKFNAGVLLQIPLGYKFYVQPELQYSQKGYKTTGALYLNPESVTISYLAVPVLVGMNIQKASIFVGPEAGFKLGVRTSEYGALDEDPFESFDIGVVVGGTYQVSPRVGIDLRYVHGFSHLLEFSWRDENNFPMGDVKDGYNRTFQLGVFYFFNDNKQD